MERMMRSVVAVVLGIFLAGIATAGDPVFYRVVGATDALITGIGPDGMLVWSNSEPTGAVVRIQHTTDLPNPDSWQDYVRFPVSGTVVSNRVFCPLVPYGMVFIPGGMNSGTDPDFGLYSLTVSSFYMDRTEVTKVLWDEVYTWAVANGYSFDNAGGVKAANHPVHRVSWYDCVKWCNARSQREGRPAVYTVSGAVYKTGQSNDVVQSGSAGYRLPTGVEWEYAARGGLGGKRFPWGDTITHSQANYDSHADYSYDISPTRGYHPTYSQGGTPYTSPVGSFAPNGYGLYDMTGNVWEWCFDWYPGYEGSYRVVRGGGWSGYAYFCRVAYRNLDSPDGNGNYAGFRAVLAPGQQ